MFFFETCLHFCISLVFIGVLYAIPYDNELKRRKNIDIALHSIQHSKNTPVDIEIYVQQALDSDLCHLVCFHKVPRERRLFHRVY